MERYEVGSILGQGAMGIVYEAFDLLLERRVAVKAIQGEQLGQEKAQERFRREAQAAASLKDPSIVTIYDVVEMDDQTCIIMELVEGKTLREVFGSRRLGVSEVIDLGMSLAQGLAEAHGKGIIHRDLKIDNVMLLASGQPKILDFGLAKYASGKDISSLSVEGQFLGTPFAMSPEQVRGEVVDHRSDLFSLGVLLYDALTGISPFQGGNLTETVARIQAQQQKAARTLNPEVSQELSDFIDLLLEKEADDRPQSASEVRHFLSSLVDGGPPTEGFQGSPKLPEKANLPAHETDVTVDWQAMPPSSSSISDTVREEVARQLESRQLESRQQDSHQDFGPGRWIPNRGVTVLAVVSLVVVSLIAVAIGMKRGERPSVAVLGIETAGPSALGSAFSQLLIQELRLGGAIRVADRYQVAKRRVELGIASLEDVSLEEVRRLGETLGVEYLIWGSHERRGEDSNNISLQMIEVESGITRLQEAEATLWDRQLGDFIESAGQKFRRELKAVEATQRQLGAARRVLPENMEAARLYALALEQFDAFDFDASRSSYQAALEISPEHPMLWAGAAESRAALGDRKGARVAIEQAKRLSDGLPRVKALEIEARSCELAGAWDCAVDGYRSLFEQFPDDLSYGIRLGNVLVDLRDLDRAGATVGQLRESRPKAALDPRIDRLAARLAHNQGDFAECARLARASGVKARQREEWLLLADVRRIEASALNRLGGKAEEVQRAQEEARDLFHRFGDSLGLAKTLERVANFEFYTNLGLSLELFEQAREIYLSEGAPILAEQANLKIIKLEAARGNLSLALERLEAVLPEVYSWVDAEEALLNLSQADQVLDLGYIHHQLGDLDTAERCYLKAKPFFAAFGNASYLGTILSNLGELAFLRGDLELSKRLHDEALAKKFESSDRPSLAYDYFRIAKIFAARGLYGSSRENLAKAFDGFESGTLDMGEALLLLAELSLLDKAAPADLASVLRAEEIFTAMGLFDQSRLALSLRGLALLSLGRFEEAGFLVQPLREALGSENPQVRLAVATALARISAHSEVSVEGDREASLRHLQEMIPKLATAGFAGAALEARLVVEEILLGQESVGTNRDLSDLEELIEEARKLGFHSLSQRGQELLMAQE